MSPFIQEEWSSGGFRDCSGISNGSPLPYSSQQAELEYSSQQAGIEYSTIQGYQPARPSYHGKKHKHKRLKHKHKRSLKKKKPPKKPSYSQKPSYDSKPHCQPGYGHKKTYEKKPKRQHKKPKYQRKFSVSKSPLGPRKTHGFVGLNSNNNFFLSGHRNTWLSRFPRRSVTKRKVAGQHTFQGPTTEGGRRKGFLKVHQHNGLSGRPLSEKRPGTSHNQRAAGRRKVAKKHILLDKLSGNERVIVITI